MLTSSPLKIQGYTVANKTGNFSIYSYDLPLFCYYLPLAYDWLSCHTYTLAIYRVATLYPCNFKGDEVSNKTGYFLITYSTERHVCFRLVLPPLSHLG